MVGQQFSLRKWQSTIVKKHARKKSFVKPLEFGQWLCRKPWPLGCTLRRAVCSVKGTCSSGDAMTQHYPTTSAAAAVWASGPSVTVSAMLLVYHSHSHSHTPYYPTEH